MSSRDARQEANDLTSLPREIREFLISRRGRITPDQVGLRAVGNRRVPGLRREEVAQLAGVSTDYYTQIERGAVGGVSDEIVGAIARALRLDDTESAHLFTLVRAARARPGSRRPSGHGRRKVPAMVSELMNAMSGVPAVVQTGTLDLVGTNALGRALYDDVFTRTQQSAPNLARFIFLDPHADEVFPAWGRTADDAVAMLHVEAARSPYASAVTTLIGELATRSIEFRTRWATHNVVAHQQGVKLFAHPVVGELSLHYEVLDVASAPGLSLVAFSAESGSPSADALQLLANWTGSTVGLPAD